MVIVEIILHAVAFTEEVSFFSLFFPPVFFCVCHSLGLWEDELLRNATVLHSLFSFSNNNVLLLFHQKNKYEESCHALVNC